MRFLIPICLVCFIVMCISCRTTKRAAYFQDIPDASLRPLILSSASFKEPQIRSGDILKITILGTESAQGGIWQSAQPATSSERENSSEYLVDLDGYISFPMVGKIRVKQLTTSMAGDTLQLHLSRFFTEPIVNVRFANFTITVLGEVNKPSSYIVAGEKISLLEALGMAGDLTIFGKRENLLLLRDSCAHTKAIRLDLNTAATIRSPYFYMLPGDVLYIEPNKDKIASLDASKTRNYALLASGLSVLIVLLSRFTF
jgi:polysaccharide export outer membrane protein